MTEDRYSVLQTNFYEHFSIVVMKECVYGWYPPANEVLKAQDIILHGESHSKPHQKRSDVKTPIYSHEQWGRSQKLTQKYNSWSRALSRTTPTPDRSKSAVINLEIRGEAQICSRPSTAATSIRTQNTFYSQPTPDEKLFSVAPPSGVNTRPPRYGLGYSRPVKAWHTKTTETNRIPDFQDYLKEIAQRLESGEPKLTPQFTPESRVSHSGRSSGYGGGVDVDGGAIPSPFDRRERIKSATTYRPRLRSQRPVKSAGPIRCTPTITPDILDRQEIEYNQGVHDRQEIEYSQGVHDRQDSRQDVHDAEDYAIDEGSSQGSRDEMRQRSEVDEELGVDNPLDYEEQLEKYGWRMQVHGDPLNLKRPCIAKRLPFTEKLPVPVIAPDPPQARSECYDTFFLNTIPHRRMTFAIDKEWASEVLHAKRMELQKRDGDTYKYRTANFSFVY
ncbi:hypothetical protein LSH36_40g22005 [Paralvinella palmiformis]|uniref:Uncharacterized protein n=1 Tax=Paralvinella palmiformis TaxID=53620 RepID=A0AAD9K985_9ANNE|nr:hypothetical protein LSH36_40g22005 [Paralvinella palmiformis]